MKTLDDAWDWYLCSRRQLELVRRLGRKHWDEIAAIPAVARDDKVTDLSGAISADTTTALTPLNDLAVLVLFSVFESVVRQTLLDQVKDEVDETAHPVVRSAVRDAVKGIENGSFYNNVLAPFKLPAGTDKDLIEQVNQVRKYRNYVAHGKRGVPAELVTPEMTYTRLKAFLKLILPPVPDA